jgi:hypothetical protein
MTRFGVLRRILDCPFVDNPWLLGSPTLRELRAIFMTFETAFFSK